MGESGGGQKIDQKSVTYFWMASKRKYAI